MNGVLRVKPFKNRRNNQFSLAVLKKNAPLKLLDLLGKGDINCLEINVKEVFFKDKKKNGSRKDVLL